MESILIVSIVFLAFVAGCSMGIGIIASARRNTV